MSEVKTYGKIAEETRLEESIKTREIAQEIIKFGVSQYQIAKLIYLLSLELEDMSCTKGVTEAINPLLEEEVNKNSNNIILT
jgi:hypothetical protein|tara:strand:- start:292 stop:537 length:246 start_codon:yes stop_codon:yes gene_type:complete